ncbi:hypothetical protein BT67DRAFT_386695, partial [Trichocladium antarcticum]
MDVPRSRPSQTTWTKNHEHQHSHDYSGQDNKSKEPKFNPHDNTQHFIRMDTPYGTIRENPVARSREKNVEFVQTWLQQTQARDLHLPRRGQHERLPDTANRSRSRADVSRHGKRPRPQSDDAPPSPKLAGQDTASKLGPKANRISGSLTRRASEPQPSKSKLNKSQKEDKELDELSAFFSRKTSQNKAR